METYGRESRGIDMREDIVLLIIIVLFITMPFVALINLTNKALNDEQQAEYIKQLEQSLNEQLEEKNVYIETLKQYQKQN